MDADNSCQKVMDANNDFIPESQPRRHLDFTPKKVYSHSDVEGSHVNNEDDVFNHDKKCTKSIPKIGMEFETENEAYEFYNNYALKAGFSVRRSKSHSSHGKLLDRIFVCSREGIRGPDKRDSVYQKRQAETRCGCEAKMKINCRKTGNYSVEIFVDEHNHNLATPSKTHHFRSHRKMGLAQAVEIDMIDSSGIAPKSGFEFMAKQGSGRESVGFSHVEYKNHLRTKRTIEIMSGDTGGVLEYLQKKQLEDPTFFYAIQVDDDDLITNIFWADAKMMADYEEFGDVSGFDTTYRKHKDGRPIALFVGVNHHKQSTIFGAALLYDETASTFMWLFDTFATAMDGKLPQTILTDQDAAMAKALASQWPQTYHRLCVWHIFQNAAIHLGHVFTKFKEFSRDFSSCVYDFEHEDDFLNAWTNMLNKYDLQNNDWLKRMFNIKEKWALVYGRDIFCADMTTTQRNESMNQLIKHYVSYKHDLRRFFSNFERLLNDRRYNERFADFKADQSTVTLPFPVEILKHASSVYTPAVLKLFHEELVKSYDCTIVEHSDVELFSQYIVSPYGKHYKYTVTFDTLEDTIQCTCRKFEFGGILCSHILKVFSTRGITRVPDKYIMKRWTKGTRNGRAMSNPENAPNEDSRVLVAGRYRDLCRLATRLSTKAAENEDEYLEVKETLAKLIETVGVKKNTKYVAGPSSIDNCCGSKQVDNVVTDSTGVKRTVRGVKEKTKTGNSSKRPKSALETSRKRRTIKQKILTTSTTNEINYASVTDSLIASSSTSLQQPQISHQVHSYQDLLGMSYPAAESLMYELINPNSQAIHQTDKDKYTTL